MIARRFYLTFSLISIGEILGCNDDTLLIPDIAAATYESSSYPLSNLYDGDQATHWEGDDTNEEIHYYFNEPVIVKQLTFQSYSNSAHMISVTDDEGTRMTYTNLDEDDDYSEITIRFNNWQTEEIHYKVKCDYTWCTSYVALIKAEVQGCYVSDPPTRFPSDVPSISPTQSPSLSPTTAMPYPSPSTVPTTSPTKEPSTVPSSSPTAVPTTFAETTAAPSFELETSSDEKTDASSIFGIQFGATEFLVIVVLLLCAVIAIQYRYRKRIQHPKPITTLEGQNL